MHLLRQKGLLQLACVPVRSCFNQLLLTKIASLLQAELIADIMPDVSLRSQFIARNPCETAALAAAEYSEHEVQRLPISRRLLTFRMIFSRF